MLKFLKTLGLLKLRNVLRVDSNMRFKDKQESKNCGLIVRYLCVKLTRGLLCWFFCSFCFLLPLSTDISWMYLEGGRFSREIASSRLACEQACGIFS